MKFIDHSFDPWHQQQGEDGPRPQPKPVDRALLTLEQWHAVRSHWPQSLRVGVWIGNDVDVMTLADDLERLSLIGLHFPKWTDGRAYSQARLLRGRLGFKGELRAMGDVLVDILPLLHRTGFDAAKLRGDQRIEVAERSLALITEHYQADVIEPRPIYARSDDHNREVQHVGH